MKEFKAKLKPFSEEFGDMFPFVVYDEMGKFFGTEVTIITDVEDSCVFIKEDDSGYYWLWDWFEKDEKRE